MAEEFARSRLLRRRLLGPLLIIAGVPAVLAAGDRLVVRAADPAPAGLVNEVSAVACPILSSTGGRLLATAAGSPMLGLVVDGSTTVLSVPVSQPAPAGTIVLAPASGVGQPVGAVWAQAGGLATWGGCTRANASSLVVLPDATRSDVVLVDPDSTDAVVDIGLIGSTGPISAAGVRGITVPAHGSHVVPLSVLAPGGQPVAVTVSATAGRVAAFGRIPGEVLPAVDAAASLTVPGLPAGATHTMLVLANPSTQRASVRVTGLTGGGPFALAGASVISLAAGTTQLVDLSASVRGESLALALSSDQPIAASVVSGSRGPAPTGVLPGATPPDLAAVPADALASGGVSLRGLVPGGTLTIANPGARVATVAVSLRSVDRGSASSLSARIPAGSMWSLTLSGTTDLSLTSTSPVAADVVVSAGAKGFAVAQLASTGGTKHALGLRQDPSLR